MCTVSYLGVLRREHQEGKKDKEIQHSFEYVQQPYVITNIMPTFQV
jgi:hypothetical protein